MHTHKGMHNKHMRTYMHTHVHTHMHTQPQCPPRGLPQWQSRGPGFESALPQVRKGSDNGPTALIQLQEVNHHSLNMEPVM